MQATDWNTTEIESGAFGLKESKTAQHPTLLDQTHFPEKSFNFRQHLTVSSNST